MGEGSGERKRERGLIRRGMAHPYAVGKIGDLWGRKMVFTLSILGAMTSYLWMTQVTSIPMLFVSRVPVGLLKQTMLAANIAISDLTDHVDRAKYLGYVSTGETIHPTGQRGPRADQAWDGTQRRRWDILWVPQ